MTVDCAVEPAFDGWFATDDDGDTHLIGGKCTQCATYVFPPRE
ncbi:zinc ribbon domain-containing protein, partial [Mycobacterium adipatum]